MRSAWPCARALGRPRHDGITPDRHSRVVPGLRVLVGPGWDHWRKRHRSRSGSPGGRVAEADPLPIACGFGIGSPSQVEAVTKHADAAIVGSALVRRLQNASDPTAAASAFVQELSTGLAKPAG